ncbi:hypothetical protein K488DRAFT_75332, partial [Vararia minispora EC-137]
VKKSSDLWLLQDYVPELREIGEWRSFIVDGKMHYGIFTQALTKGDRDDGHDMTTNMVTSVPPLKDAWAECSNGTMDDLGRFLNLNAHAKYDKGRKQVQDFIFTTLHHLQVLKDRQMMSVPNSLFMCVDISIIRNEEKETYDIFTNELTRSISAVRFVEKADAQGDQLLLDFGIVLRKLALRGNHAL